MARGACSWPLLCAMLAAVSVPRVQQRCVSVLLAGARLSGDMYTLMKRVCVTLFAW